MTLSRRLVLAFLLLCLPSCQQAENEYPELNCFDQLTGVYAAGSNIEDNEFTGGYYRCKNNFPKPCSDKSPNEIGTVALLAVPEDTPLHQRYIERYGGKYRGRSLRLINRSEQVVEFAACDSALYIVQGAFADGKWQPIERFREPICGGSYHRVFLAPNEQWEFVAPRFTGLVKTRLRFRLEARGDRDFQDLRERWTKADGRQAPPKGNLTIYSNEFDGAVNPEQFVR